MRTWMEQRREGEYIGPVDWAFDFVGHCVRGGGIPEPEKRAAECLANLKTIVEARERGDVVEVSVYGCTHEVLKVGMYDGWPYWVPIPSVRLKTWMGGEWHPWTSLYFAPHIRAAPAGPTRGEDGR